MRIVDETGFRIGYGYGIFQPNELFLTVVIKGTFAIEQNQPCRALPKAEQARIGKAQMYVDEHGNSQKTDGEMAPFKAKADCIFIGSAYTPSRLPQQGIEVEFQVGSMRKRLAVIGNRTWSKEGDGIAHVHGPELFTELPIRNEYAHGGPKSKFNPHGIGFGDLDKTVPIANIVAIGAETPRWDEDAMPEGLGVLPPNYLPRRKMAGTFDDDWLYRRRPMPPRDFDLAHHNSTRPDQQVDGYLMGDEQVHLENLHPSEPDFDFALPGLRVRCFAEIDLHPDHGGYLDFEELATHLDTCIVDMPKETVTLFWRGTLKLLSRRHERVKHLLLVQEQTDSPLPRSHYRDLLAQKKAAEEPPSAEMGPTQEQRDEIAALNERGMRQVLSTLREGGAPDDLISKVEQEISVERAMKILTDYVEEIKKTLPPDLELPGAPDT